MPQRLHCGEAELYCLYSLFKPLYVWMKRWKALHWQANWPGVRWSVKPMQRSTLANATTFVQ